MTISCRSPDAGRSGSSQGQDGEHSRPGARPGCRADGDGRRGPAHALAEAERAAEAEEAITAAYLRFHPEFAAELDAESELEAGA